jgi:hypothetical protein
MLLENAKIWPVESKKFGALIVIMRMQISQDKYILFSVNIFDRLRA